jgi:hypothetical protein
MSGAASDVLYGEIRLGTRLAGGTRHPGAFTRPDDVPVLGKVVEGCLFDILLELVAHGSNALWSRMSSLIFTHEKIAVCLGDADRASMDQERAMTEGDFCPIIERWPRSCPCRSGVILRQLVSVQTPLRFKSARHGSAEFWTMRLVTASLLTSR